MMTNTDRHLARARLRLAAALQQAGGRGDVREHQAVGLPQWSEDDQTLAKALQRELKVRRGRAWRPRSASCAGRCRLDEDNTRRRLRRHRRRLAGTSRRSRCAIRRTSPACRATTGRTRSPWPRRSRTRASSPAPRCMAMTMLDLLTQAGARASGLGLLQQRPDQGREVHPAHLRRTSRPSPEQEIMDEVSRADEEVLLRPDEVHRPIWISWASVPDDSHVGHQATATGTVIPLDHRGAGANACPPGALRARIPPPVGSSFLLCGGLMSRPAGRSPHLILRVQAGSFSSFRALSYQQTRRRRPGDRHVRAAAVCRRFGDRVSWAPRSRLRRSISLAAPSISPLKRCAAPSGA